MKKNSIILLAAIAILFIAYGRSHLAAQSADATVLNIQAAIEGARPGDTVIIKEGHYVENLSITKPLFLRKAPGTGTVVVSAKDVNLPAISIVGTSEVFIEGIVFEGSETESGILVLQSSMVSISGCSARENRIGITLMDSKSCSLRNNRTEFNETYGIYLERSSGNTVSGNISGQNLDKGIFLSYSDNNTITDNSTNRNKWNGILLWDSHDNSITDNKAYRNMYSIIESESSGNRYDNNSTLPNLYIILPIIMIYTGIIFYLLQRLIIRKALSIMGKRK